MDTHLYIYAATCDDEFCLNGGTCHLPGNNCTCLENWTGMRCDQSNNNYGDNLIYCINLIYSPFTGQEDSSGIAVPVIVVMVVVVPLAWIGLLLVVAMIIRRRKKSTYDLAEVANDRYNSSYLYYYVCTELKKLLLAIPAISAWFSQANTSWYNYV